MNEPTRNGQEPAKEAKPSFSTVLKQSDVPYLKFIGSCMDFFGVRTVIAFLSGLSAIYAYAAIFGQPPYFPTKSPEQQTIQLNGVVQTLENKPLEEFNIAAVSDFVPVTSPNGAFQLEVPNHKLYNLIVWEPTDGIFHLYGNLVPTHQEGNSQYKVEPLTRFPTKLGFVQGSAKDLNNNPIEGVVEIEGKKAKIDSAGNFTLMGIPIGKTKIRVLPSGDPQKAWEEELQVSVSGATVHDVAGPR